MKQLFQDLRNGNLLLEDIPAPLVSSGSLLATTTYSLISPGTERMLLEFGKAGYLEKARQQPEKVIQVLQKIRSDGFIAALQAVKTKLEQPLPLGYCNVGKIIEIGEGVSEFKIGDRIVSNSKHAEIVSVTKLLCAKIPEEVDDEDASFTVLGAVALEGIRLLKPELGETVAVFGLGLIGLLAVQILKANGVRVLALDLNEGRAALARGFGIEAFCSGNNSDPVKIAEAFSNGHGVDAVLICAATKSDSLIHQAAKMCRKRGRIVLTGVTGLKLQRSDFYDKELSFQVSCAYGPGRHDSNYETHGTDYPIAYARWTIQRNFEAVLTLMKDRRIDVKPLISKRLSFLEAGKAYKELASGTDLGILLIYDESGASPKRPGPIRVIEHRQAASNEQAIAIIGPGSFAQLQIIPTLKKSGLRLKWSISESGQSASLCAKKFGFEKSSSQADEAFNDPDIQSVLIATRHDSHASLVIEALKSGKNVYVEKPLCLSKEELNGITKAYMESTSKNGSGPLLMLGFNRRFSPLIQALMGGLKNRAAPLSMSYNCNAGFIPKEHWVHETRVGGGRIIGELCHFVDLLSFISGARITSLSAYAHGKGIHSELKDTLCASMQFEDGSIGTINYFANGHKSYPKEQLEVFIEGQVFRIDNFRRIEAFGCREFSGKSLWKQDKGHANCIHSFIQAISKGEASPISFESIEQSMKATFAVVDSIQEGRRVEL